MTVIFVRLARLLCRIIPTPTGNLIDQTVCHRIASKLGVAFHFHLFHNARTVAADRFYADMKPGGNLGQGDAVGDHSHHYVVFEIMWRSESEHA